MEAIGFDSRTIRGLVLAGGDGRRLQPYIQEVKGKKLPKQFVNFVGKHSMVEQTFRRVERLIPADQILTVITRQHLLHPEVCRQLARRRSETIVVQPSNKETGPGILLPLAFIYKRLPEAIVALFPSDHFILQEERFMSYVTLAIQAVKHDPTQIILLAIEPHKPEPEYGYILPCENSGSAYRFGTRPVSGFVEKPRPELAVELVMAGALWNTMTMVFKLRTLWELVQRVHPALYANFHRILEAIGTAEEQRTVNDVYDGLQPVNFSKEITEKIADRHPKSIAVLPVRDVFWSDLGSRERVLQVVRRLNQHGAEEIHAVTQSIQTIGVGKQKRQYHNGRAAYFTLR
jgi:mannose-1-phosphate guanylyltransferase